MSSSICINVRRLTFADFTHINTHNYSLFHVHPVRAHTQQAPHKIASHERRPAVKPAPAMFKARHVLGRQGRALSDWDVRNSW